MTCNLDSCKGSECLDCAIAKCPNYLICNQEVPLWCLRIHSGLCMNCEIAYGTWQGGKGILNIIDSIECPICLETTQGVTQPKCDHTLCIKCFKRCHYGDDDLTNMPLFPYPELEDEYDSDSENPKWLDYPEIQIYNEQWNKWDDSREIKRFNENYLSKCPICRS